MYSRINARRLHRIALSIEAKCLKFSKPTIYSKPEAQNPPKPTTAQRVERGTVVGNLMKMPEGQNRLPRPPPRIELRGAATPRATTAVLTNGPFHWPFRIRRPNKNETKHQNGKAPRTTQAQGKR